MPDTFTAVYNFTKPEVNASRDTWGGKDNSNWDALDGILAALNTAKAPLASPNFSGTPAKAGVALATVNDVAAAIAAAIGLTPVGIISDFAGSAPNVPPRWLLCYGQAISRTTYAALYAIMGTSYGAGDGLTTFNLPDLRGRVTAGVDNMGGGAAAGRLTGYTFATVGGAQSHSLTSGEMPSHTHGVNDAGHTHTATDNGHTHGVTDPGHDHDLSGSTQWVGSLAGGGTAVFIPIQATRATTTDTTGISINSGTASISVGGSLTGISLQSTGGGAAHNNVQPTMAMNKIIYTGVL